MALASKIGIFVMTAKQYRGNERDLGQIFRRRTSVLGAHILSRSNQRSAYERVHSQLLQGTSALGMARSLAREAATRS